MIKIKEGHVFSRELKNSDPNVFLFKKGWFKRCMSVHSHINEWIIKMFKNNNNVSIEFAIMLRQSLSSFNVYLENGLDQLIGYRGIDR